MLALTRKVGQSIVIGDQIEVTIVKIEGDQVRVGIRAPKEVSIFRKEIYDEIRAENRAAVESANLPLDGLDQILSLTVQKPEKEIVSGKSILVRKAGGSNRQNKE